MSADLAPLRHSVVRICRPDGTYAGLGYRFSETIVVTCAHVAAAALTGDLREAKAEEPPPGEVVVDVPFAPGEDARATARASILPGGWLPLRDDNAPADLAVLRLSAPLPLSGSLMPLEAGLSLTGHPFLAYGGPEGHERHLVLIEGRVRAAIGNGRYQLSAAASDYPIEPGCSGAPAASTATGTALGLIAQDEQDPSIRAGFLIPAAQLRQALARVGIAAAAPPSMALLRAWTEAHLRNAGFQLAGQVRRFVDYYAGASDRPMPFAGRDGALAELDGWLAAGGGAFGLLTGAAGLGKSALLLHWMARLLGRGERVHLLFLPVSIRFDTADELRGLRLLYAQLVGVSGEPRFAEGIKPDQEDYRDRIGAGWEAIANRPQERFLLVIDGADEASGDWLKDRVLPYAIPPNLSVVVAARYPPGHTDGRAWLEAFRFAPECPRPKPLDLKPLAKGAVGEAVAQLGRPLDALPERAGVLDALYRLTDRGDPLLVTLWVGELWKERERAPVLGAADLRRLKPSFAGFLDVWMQEQATVWKAQGIDVHRDDFERLLRVLSLARGPLRLTDLLAVVGRLPSIVHWDFERARSALDCVFRLVVGDAERQGYAFVHPRLREHFRAELEGLKEERRAVPHAYLEWGAATVASLNDGSLAPEQCPAYPLRHYTAQVLDAGLAPDEALDRHLLPLLGSGWHRAWHEEEGAYGGYLTDLHRVQDTLRQANQDRRGPPYRIGQELRCLLIRASVFSLTQNLPPELIVALAKAGEWSLPRALRVAEQLADPAARAQTLTGLAWQVTGEERRQVLHQALEAATSIGDEEYRAHALATVARQLDSEERRQVLHQALEAAADIGDDWARAHALAAMAKQLEGEPALLRQAREIATGISHEGYRTEVLAALAGQLTGEPALLRQAQKVATGIGDKGHRTKVRAALVDAWSSSSDYSRLAKRLDAMGVSPRRHCLTLLQSLTPVIPVLGGKAAVRETANAIVDTARWWP